MIIRHHGTTPLLITQPDHARLAVSIMERWRDGGLPESPRRAEILLAIKEHDNGWQEVDAAPIVDPGSGDILDFMHLPDDDRRGVWPRGVQRLASTPYAAALVAQHAVHIYRRYRDDASWTPFFAEMEGWRDHFLQQVPNVGMDELLSDYSFVRVGDLASLTYCNGWSEAPDETTHAIKCDGERLTIREVGPPLTSTVKRGLLEPSVTRFGETFYITIRAEDGRGYVSVSDDGLNYEPQKAWSWDDGTPLDMSTTQQHWLAHSYGLFLVYTRKDPMNVNVPRWRAPLWMAEVDIKTLRLIKGTERIVLPLVGDGVNDAKKVAFMGNFGVCNASADESWVTDGSWCPWDASKGQLQLARVKWTIKNDLVQF